MGRSASIETGSRARALHLTSIRSMTGPQIPGNYSTYLPISYDTTEDKARMVFEVVLFMGCVALAVVRQLRLGPQRGARRRRVWCCACGVRFGLCLWLWWPQSGAESGQRGPKVAEKYPEEGQKGSERGQKATQTENKAKVYLQIVLGCSRGC